MKFFSPLLKLISNRKNIFKLFKKKLNSTENQPHKTGINLKLFKNGCPKFTQLKTLKEFLSPKEKKIIKLLSTLIVLCIFSLGIKFYFDNSIVLPKSGGSYTEGLIGTPQYLNPIISSYNDVHVLYKTLITHQCVFLK